MVCVCCVCVDMNKSMCICEKKDKIIVWNDTTLDSSDKRFRSCFPDVTR